MQHFCNDGHLYNPYKLKFQILTVQNLMNADSDEAEYFIQVSSFFHFLETIDRSNTCFVL